MRDKKPLAVVLCIIAIFFLGDYYIGQKQESIIKERRQKAAVGKLAFYMIFPI